MPPRHRIKFLLGSSVCAVRCHKSSALVTNCFSRDSPDDSRTVLDIRDFRGILQGSREVRTAIVISGSPDDGRGADLAIFAGIGTHSSHRLLLSAWAPGVSRRRWWWLLP